MPSGSRTTSVHVLLSLSGEACPSTPLQWQPCPWRIWWGSLPLQLHGVIQVLSNLQFMYNSLNLCTSAVRRGITPSSRPWSCNSLKTTYQDHRAQRHTRWCSSSFYFRARWLFIFIAHSLDGQPGIFVINSKLWRKQHMQEVVIFSKPSPKGERNLTKTIIKYKFELVHHLSRNITGSV